jgi:hypothetical protein
VKQIVRQSIGIAVLILCILIVAAFTDADAHHQANSTDMKAADGGLLQFKSGRHILGFAPGKVYLASVNHALSVEFLGTKGVLPGAEGKEKSSKSQPLGKVTYKNLWEGVNLTYVTSKDGIAESVYHVSPGADASKIRLKYNAPVNVQKDGSLRIKFDKGYMTESAPIAWQDIDGIRVPVKVAFKVSGNEVQFETGEYDHKHPLVIDPTYSWHTFYGSGGEDKANAIAVDRYGNVYIAGSASGTWGEPKNAYAGGSDIFVMKLGTTGDYRWHTYYGCQGTDVGTGIALDSNGDIYVSAYSVSTWGSPLHAHSLGNDMVALKLDSDGGYKWHTFYGSSSAEVALGIAVDNSNVYLTGYGSATWGSPLKPYIGGIDIIVLKLDSNGNYLWHTFYGSADDDAGNGIAIDRNAGTVYIVGNSESSWGSPLHGHSENDDIVVLKLDSDGGYKWHTFYGSEMFDYGRAVAVDSRGRIFVTGNSSESWNGPDGALDPPKHAHSGAHDIFVLKLNSNGSYMWHTFYGSWQDDSSWAISLDSGENVYVAGSSHNTWNGDHDELPLHPHTITASQIANTDLVVLKLTQNGDYRFHTFYGQADYDDESKGIALHSMGSIYTAGYSVASWNGDAGPLNSHTAGHNSDIFALKLAPTTCPESAVRINETGHVYSNIQAAYDDADTNQQIQTQVIVFVQDLDFLRNNISVMLSGGFECDYQAAPVGYSAISGRLLIRNSKVTIDKLIIR